MFEKVREFIIPTKETRYKDFKNKLVGCKLVSNRNDKLAGVCWSQNKAFRVNNIMDTSEIANKCKCGLTLPIERRTYRDYSRIRMGTKIGLIALGSVNPLILAKVKPVTDIFL